MKIDLLVLRCKALETSRRFYESLGFGFVAEQHGGGPLHYSSQDADFVFELYPAPAQDAVGNTRLGFCVKQIPQALCDAPTTTHQQVDGEWVYIVRDPDGRTLELREQSP